MLGAMDPALKWWRLPAVGRDKGRLIRRLIERYRPKRAIEIGSLFGYSAVLIGASLPAGGPLVCIEASEFPAELVRRNAAAARPGQSRSVTVRAAPRLLPLLPPRFHFAP